MKKKICMIVTSFTAKGGITTVVNGYRDSKLEEAFDIKYIESYCDGSIIRKFFQAIKAYIRFVYLLIFWKPEIIHVHSSFGGSFYRKLPFILIASWCGLSVVNHIHGSYYQEFYLDSSSTKKKFVRYVYQKCDRIIALSEEAKVILAQIAPNVPIFVIENFGLVHPEAFLEQSEDNAQRTVLFLGFISEKKGCFDIPEVVRIVISQAPDVQFILAGSGEIESVKKRASEETLKHLVFPGWVRSEEKNALLKKADIFFLPSYSEAMPMSVLEAMGYGLPIVSTTVGGIPKIVQHGRNGFLLEPGDAAGMAQAIIIILKNSEQKRIMGQESLNILKSGYSLDSHLAKLNEIYRGL